MNIAFGVQSILSGSQELEYGGSQKLDGQLDVASGAFMVARGVAELAAATEAPLIAIPGVGEILAGIGMEICESTSALMPPGSHGIIQLSSRSGSAVQSRSVHLDRAS